MAHPVDVSFATDPDAENGVQPHALDPAAAARLWDISLYMPAVIRHWW